VRAGLAAAMLLALPLQARGGWYLLVPDPALVGDPRVEEATVMREPLAKWWHVGSFDSAEDCEQDSYSWARFLLKKADGAQTKPAARERLKLAANLVRCIETSDPRLRDTP
jgi:hypothetical protein